METKQTTMRDVAKLAGVSLNVVSLVCNPKPGKYVSVAAKTKVKAAIDELKYFPDNRGRILRVQRTNTIGFYSSSGAFTLDNGFGTAIFEGSQRACSKNRQDMLVFHFMESRSAQDIVNMLSSTKVDGLIFLGSGSNELDEALHRVSKPTVRVGEPYPGSSSVAADDYDGSRRLANHLFRRGHRRVLYRLCLQKLASATSRFEGFCDAAKTLRMEVIPSEPANLDDDITEEEAHLLENFRSNHITAVAGWRDWSASRVLAFCSKRGIFVPDDIAVVGFDGITPHICPPQYRPTTVVVEWSLIAEIAVDKLLRKIAGETASDEIVQPCSLYVGNTS